jgi:tetratricopeptide (TPR) repeat protein
LYERTQGNPLYVQEIALHGTTESQSLQRLIETRLLSLAAPARSALEAGAVLGREFTHGVWQAVAGSGILAEIPPLIAARFIEESQMGYRFQHDLIREMGYKDIRPERLRALHHRAGEVLLHERAEPAVLAWHFEQAEVWPEAVRYHREAGEWAAKAYAFEAALDHYARAESMLKHLSAPKIELLAILRKRQVMYEFQMRDAEWRATIAEVEKIASEVGDTEALVDSLDAQITQHRMDSNWTEMQKIGDRLIAVARQTDNKLAEARAHTTLGWHLVDALGRLDEARPHLEQAVALTEAINDFSIRPYSLTYLAFAQRLAGQTQAARANLKRALVLCADRPELQLAVLNARQALSQIEMDLAHWEIALSIARELIPLRQAMGDAWSTSSTLFHIGRVCTWMGQYEKGLDYQKAIYALPGLGELSADSPLTPYFKALAADLYVQSNNLLEAENVLASQEDWLEHTETGRPLLMMLNALARLRLAQGNPAAALDVATRGVSIWKQSGGTAEIAILLLHSLAAVRAGDRETAQTSLAYAESELNKTDVAMHNVLLHLLHYELSDKASDLSAAWVEIQRQADQFADSGLRSDFLNNVPLHREVKALWQAMPSAPQVILAVHLARTNTPLGKTLSEADRIKVQWTVDSGAADAEFLLRHGKIALRHHRLQRLIAEAQAQGATPTDLDLAQALGVNVRTIERDMALIRSQGKSVPTRRRKMSG